MKAADHQPKLQPRDPLDAVPPPICYLMMPLKESAVPSRLAHDRRRKRILGYGHRIRLSMPLEGVEFHALELVDHRTACGSGQQLSRGGNSRDVLLK